ncbi:MAG: D-aminoacyl-tRNA deacylase, partial [Propionibacteriaceae bacterium]|nr:D-aminoacyl-tRNA deacylase [Propionibacteriaceae bacterium]
FTGLGLCVFVGVTHSDDEAVAERLAAKIWQLRIFEADATGRQLSAADKAAPVLVVSQFTLYADTRKGRRPSWNQAAPRTHSEPLVESFVRALRNLGAEVTTGRFGAMMQVSLVNDGPVTLIVDYPSVAD